MPKAQWGVNAKEVDSYDRDSSYAPYTGPIPGNGVYQWRVKLAKYVAGSRNKFPQLRVGLTLVPRGADEKKYKDYFIMAFLPVSDKTAFRYVPFLDAIEVSGNDFTDRTVVDEEGNIQRIGPWRNDGQSLILGNLVEGTDQNDNIRKEIGWMGALTEDVPDDDEELDDSDAGYVDDVDDEEYDDDEDDSEWE